MFQNQDRYQPPVWWEDRTREGGGRGEGGGWMRRRKEGDGRDEGGGWGGG